MPVGFLKRLVWDILFCGSCMPGCQHFNELKRNSVKPNEVVIIEGSYKIPDTLRRFIVAPSVEELRGCTAYQNGKHLDS